MPRGPWRRCAPIAIATGLPESRLVSGAATFYIRSMTCAAAIFPAILLALLTALPAQAEKRLYRYTSPEGNVVIDDRVPREFVGGGYEVIDPKGRVLEVVPRTLSPEERAARSAEERAQAEAEAAAERAKERDYNLLLRYSSVEDIQAAKERALSDLQIRISILKSNRSSLRQQVEAQQAQAADLERQGREVDAARLQAMEDLRQELLSTERSIAAREAEVAEVAAAYDDDIERFEELLALVELRRRKERGEEP